MALIQLANTKSRILKDIKFGQKYYGIIYQYLEKICIERFDIEDTKNGWYLPHLPVLRPGKSKY